ncbi:hypothetical protein VE04_06958 [Pseudogymnoascus sp. 24MN13]|nr:hypothetical protein VE04_06958 [Pseudogymnoascus sp. 24MN13]
MCITAARLSRSLLALKYICVSSPKITHGSILVLQVCKRIHYAPLSASRSQVREKPLPPRLASSLKSHLLAPPSITWIPNPNHRSERWNLANTTNEDLLGGILATLKRVELLLSQQNHPRPSGLSEDSAHDSGDAERHSDREDDNIEGQSGNEEEGEGGVDEDNQEDGNEAENENQQNANEAEEWTSCGRKGDIESVAEPAMSNIANMPEFGEVIGFGKRLPHNPGFLLLFSQAFLEKFEADEIHFSPDITGTVDRWTITILAPSNFYEGRARFQFLKFSTIYGSHAIDTMLEAINISLELIVNDWQKLYDEVRKECDGENISFMDGEEYVHLLYDDSNFRRSRFYFWAIGCLGSFEQSVAETLWELTTFRTEVRDKIPSHMLVTATSEYFDEIYKEEMDIFDQAYNNLDGIHDQLVKKRDEMKVLRDGCKRRHGKPAVSNSCRERSAAGFRDNIFLPLAFSASLWSIPGVNEKYPGIMVPGAFAAITGFITYLIVYNLNLLISGLRRLFYVPRSILLTRMANEKYYPKYDSEDDSEDDSKDDSKGHPEGSSVKNSTSARGSVSNSTNSRSSVSNSRGEVGSVNNSIHEGISVGNSMREGVSVNNSTREGSSMNNSMNVNERSSVNDSIREDSSVNNSASDGSGKKKHHGIKSSTDWPTRAKAFEVFPHQDEGPRPSNWLLLFYAIRLLVLKTFDLVIGFMAWLREVIASDPSNQDPDTEMASRPTPRR